MTKFIVSVFICTIIYIQFGSSQGIVHELFGKGLVSHLRDSSSSGGSSSRQSGSWDRGDDYDQYRDSTQQRQSQRSSSSDGTYSMQKDSKRGDRRSGGFWDSGHQHWN